MQRPKRGEYNSQDEHVGSNIIGNMNSEIAYQFCPKNILKSNGCYKKKNKIVFKEKWTKLKKTREIILKIIKRLSSVCPDAMVSIEHV